MSENKEIARQVVRRLSDKWRAISKLNVSATAGGRKEKVVVVGDRLDVLTEDFTTLLKNLGDLLGESDGGNVSTGAVGPQVDDSPPGTE
jgi:hypothetical protein